MADIKPFRCIRPLPELASRVAALPYDVYSRAEAAVEAKKDELSFLNIDRPETQFSPYEDMYSEKVYRMTCSGSRWRMGFIYRMRCRLIMFMN